MKLIGPDRFSLMFDASRFEICAPDGSNKVRGRAADSDTKLYVFSVDSEPIYVGVTKRPLRTRLRYGWTANGKSGYHGYAFRRSLRSADLHVWYLEGRENVDPLLDAETIEAEVVFLLRWLGQWPKYQTEIHFHPSERRHRELATQILRHYDRAL